MCGISGVSLSVAELNNFCFDYNSVIAKIFETNNSNTIAFRQFYSGN